MQSLQHSAGPQLLWGKTREGREKENMCVCASEREKEQWEGNTWDRRHLDILWLTQFVQHCLQSFYCKKVGAFGNIILIQHPEVIKELEMAVAQMQNEEGC